MPKVKNPLFSQEARGGIGGLVYNTWRGINTVKTNTSPTGQGTAKRLAAQALLIQAAQLWQGLTDTNRANWRQYAIDHPVADWTGSPKRLTGMNWYVSCAVQMLRLGNTPVDDPPGIAAPDAPVDFAISQSTADLVAEWTSPTADGNNIEVFIVGPLSAGINARLEQAQFLLSTGDDAAQALNLITAALPGRYTAFARIVDVTYGLVSSWVSSFADIT